MWNIIAIVIIALNGALVGAPEHLTHPRTFDTEQQCKDFDVSPEHKNALQRLLRTELEEHKPNEVEIFTRCVPAPLPGTGI